MKISIIIACKNFNPYLEECLRHCLELKYPEFEIIVLPDEDFKFPHAKVKIIPTGAVTPPQKRNRVLETAAGELLAFIDDDAYPKNDWLELAFKYFEDSQIAAVGGPAITPLGEGIRQVASGLIYESPLVSDGFTYRYRPQRRREVEDYPSCNFIIRSDSFRELGGFKTNFWPGEDTFLCLELTRKLHKKIIYLPELVVFHHRRPLFKAHLRQVSNYALHRGYFAKRFPETSFKLSYLIPTVFVLSILFLGIVSLIFPGLRLFYILLILSYFSVVSYNSLFYPSHKYLSQRRYSFAKLTFLVFSGIISTHLTYGLFFVKGLLTRRLKEE